jgi:hypothetical protein
VICWVGSARGAYRCDPGTLSKTPRRRKRIKNFADLVAGAIPAHARDKTIELWWQNEARVGQQGTLTRIWAERGSRPCAPTDTAVAVLNQVHCPFVAVRPARCQGLNALATRMSKGLSSG